LDGSGCRTIPLAAYGIKAIDLGGKHSSEVFRAFVPGARVVKAFNHLDARVLPEPTVSGCVLFYSGDDADAKSEVRKIIEHTGYFKTEHRSSLCTKSHPYFCGYATV
jgi:8-hydroxy-5-deazaflavin:NADPH oxidoreductase